MTDAPSLPTFGAVILAGGKSSRMGQPKAWLPWRGKPLLAHIVDVVASVCNHPIVVVGVAGQELPPLHPSAVRVDDPSEYEQGGPLVGLFAGLGVLAAHQTDIAFLGACDNLFLTPDHLCLLFAALLTEPKLGGILPVDAPDSGESTDRQTGGDAERAPEEKPLAVTAAGPDQWTFTAPQKPGAYRVFLIARDGRGAASAENIPFQVR